MKHWIIDNHDEGRGVYRFGDGGTRAMMALAFLAPRSIPFLLCGQEFGAENRPPIHERIQPCDKGYRRIGGQGVAWRAGVESEGNLFARGIEARRAWFSFYMRYNCPSGNPDSSAIIRSRRCSGKLTNARALCQARFAASVGPARVSRSMK